MPLPPPSLSQEKILEDTEEYLIYLSLILMQKIFFRMIKSFKFNRQKKSLRNTRYFSRSVTEMMRFRQSIYSRVFLVQN